jgi:hypothetical protein
VIASSPTPPRHRIRIYGQLRKPINEDLIMQALLIIIEDLARARRSDFEEREAEP